jgi:hypothetical protein
MVALQLSRDVLLVALIWLVLLWLTMCQSGCMPPREPCGTEQLAAIEAAYIAEVVAACKREGSKFDDCHARGEIERRYAELREEWVRCR